MWGVLELSVVFVVDLFVIVGVVEIGDFVESKNDKENQNNQIK